jgi:hypothetical protein
LGGRLGIAGKSKQEVNRQIVDMHDQNETRNCRVCFFQIGHLKQIPPYRSVRTPFLQPFRYLHILRLTFHTPSSG